MNLSEKQFQAMLSRFVNGQCSPEEEKLVKAWYSSITTKQQTDIDPELRKSIERRLWSDLQARTGISRAGGIGRQRKLWVPVSIAASLLVVIFSLGIFFLSNRNTDVEISANGSTKVFNSSDTVRQIFLSDGSLVELQPGGSIRYQDMTKGKNREVHLHGGAFFDVAHDRSRPFIVYSGEVVTRVLGTSFIIQPDKSGDVIDVVVKSGKVAVSQVNLSSAEAVIVTRNQKASFHKSQKKIVARIVEDPEPLPQEEQQLTMKFDAAPIADILQRLERAYGIAIMYDSAAIEKCFLTTELAEEGLYERLDIICEAIGGTYKIQEKSIVITGNGCE